MSDVSTHGGTIRELIAEHQRFAESGNPYERIVGTVLAAGSLRSKLADLTDKGVTRDRSGSLVSNNTANPGLLIRKK